MLQGLYGKMVGSTPPVHLVRTWKLLRAPREPWVSAPRRPRDLEQDEFSGDLPSVEFSVERAYICFFGC